MSTVDDCFHRTHERPHTQRDRFLKKSDALWRENNGLIVADCSSKFNKFRPLRKKLNENKPPATFLSPVRLENVLYGSGDFALGVAHWLGLQLTANDLRTPPTCADRLR